MFRVPDLCQCEGPPTHRAEHRHIVGTSRRQKLPISRIQARRLRRRVFKSRLGSASAGRARRLAAELGAIHLTHFALDLPDVAVDLQKALGQLDGGVH